MNVKINIEGMHCDACTELIRMELEEIGLTDQIKKIEVVGGSSGSIELTDIEEAKLEEAVEVINKMKEYTVVSSSTTD